MPEYRKDLPNNFEHLTFINYLISWKILYYSML